MFASRAPSRAPRESRAAGAHRPARSSWPLGFSSWAVLTTVVIALYVLLTLGIIFQSPVLTWDAELAGLHLRHNHPGWLPFVFYYVMFGQRGPATLAFLPFFIWQAWRDRTSRPLVMLVTSLILLNVSVGVVKLATGRIGPRANPDVHLIFTGGNIYPSGHVSNAVVLYGLIALLSVHHRKLATFAAVFLSVTVGLGTVYLRSHWFSDVVGGWLAGALVLLALPIVMPTAQRWSDALVARVRRRLERRRSGGSGGSGGRRDDYDVDVRPRTSAGVRSVRILASAELGGAHQPQNETITPVRSRA